MRTIVFNQNNIVQDGLNSTLVYKFPNSVQFKNNYIAVQKIALYYSWYNISAALGNNKFTYTWFSGATKTTYNVTIPDGIYDITSLNSYLEYVFIQNNTYMTTSTGNNVYFAQFELNVSRYAVQLCTFRVPSASNNPNAYVASSLGYPSKIFNPSVTIPANFNVIIGFPAGWSSPENIDGIVPPFTVTGSGTYNGVAYDYNNNTGAMSFYSSQSPEVTVNASVYVTLTCIENPYASPASTIYAISPTSGIGSLIIDTPPNFGWNKLIDGNYNQLRMQFLDLDFQPLKINDPNMTILLIIKDGDEYGGK